MSALHVRPFALLADAQLDQAVAALAPLLAQWATGWGVRTPVLRAQRAGQATPGAAAAGVSGQGGNAWFCWHADWHNELQRVLFAGDRPSGPAPELPARLAPAAARQAGQELEALLATALVGKEHTVHGGAAPASLRAPGAGSLALVIAIGKYESAILLDGACVRALCPSAPAALPPLAPVDRRAALAATPVALDVTIGAAQVGLSSLLALATGDVIRLKSPVDAPVGMNLPAGTPLFHVYLGKIGDDIAVELASRA